MQRRVLTHRLRGSYGDKSNWTTCGKSREDAAYWSRYWSKVTCPKCLRLRVPAAVALVILALATVNAQGRKPGDPATWGDVQNVQRSVDSTNARQSAQESAIADATDASNASMEMKYLLDASVRVLDTKRTTFELFNSFDARHGQNHAIGARFTIKMGSSYEERELQKLRMEIEALKNRPL